MTPLRNFWHTIAASLWFVPSLLVVGGMLLAIGLIGLDMRFDFPERIAGTVFGVGADGARGVLTAIATSVVTVAGVAFSITIVTLSLASSQYSPRVLRNFMGDRTNQWVLGVLVATFAYCVVVLQTIHGGDEGSFVPSTAVFGAVLFSLVAIGSFVYFIHHIATAIQASSIIARVASDAIAAVGELPELGGPDGSPAKTATEDELPRLWRPVRALRNGYVQRIDADGLAAFAVRHGTVVRIERGIGAFVRAGRPLVSLDAGTAPIAAESTALAACFVVAPMRTTEQDALFGVRQLVDVALKALSPGVNDTTTAILCVDWLGAVLIGFIRRDFPPLLRRDDEGALRVIGPIARWDEIVALAFDEIRQSAHGNSAVLRRQIELLEDLAEEATSPPRRRCLRRHAEWIVLTARRTILLSVDRAPIEAAGRRMRDRFPDPAARP